MKLLVQKGRTSLLVRVKILDSSSTTGAGLTGLTSASSGLVCYRARDDDGNAAGTAISLSAGTRGTWSSGGFVEKDATNMPGYYEFGVPNAAIATGSETANIILKGATNMAPCDIEIQLVAFDPQNATSLGLTDLDAAISTRLASASYTAPSNLTAAQIATGIWQDTTASDFTTALSVGKSLMNGVALGTGLTIASVSGSVGSVTAGVTVSTNNDKTGYTASTVSDKTGYSLSASGIGAIYTTAMTESYAGAGVVPTLAQILFETRALQAEKAVAGTTLTAKKIDGSTTAGTYTLNDATAPTAITRAT